MQRILRRERERERGAGRDRENNSQLKSVTVFDSEILNSEFSSGILALI